MTVSRRPIFFLLALLTAFALGGAAPLRSAETPAPRPDLVLLTLDTTRADFLGCYGGSATTPNLDALAARGTRYARALSSVPLTLPAHASLLTGLAPPEHGIHDNGTARLAEILPTLTTVLAGEGYATAAFVASRVLDRRFGLARGFEEYDDRMAAEIVGEYGYPERDAAAVTEAALDWLARRPRGRPFFLWVHYYDPHAPYAPPPQFRRATTHGDYAGEIAYMDREIGRLLSSLPDGAKSTLIAAVGDHGESLGEHGERAHGIFLYRAGLEVPLLLAGPGVPAGRVVAGTVAADRLAPTLLRLLRVKPPSGGLASAGLPGLEAKEPKAEEGGEDPAGMVYSETHMPATAYGWSPLKAISDSRWRLIVAPRPELYDFVADPGESENLIDRRRPEARRLKLALEALEAGFARREAPAAETDPELAAALRSLGYHGGSTPPRPGAAGALDPKDGIALLAELEAAKELMTAGEFRAALPRLEALVERNPGNVPFLTQLARARLGAGQGEAAVATYRRAVELNPRLHFLHLNLADALRRLGRAEEAKREYELVLELHPRAAAAWLALAEMANQAGQATEERKLLARAAAAGTASGVILARLGQMEMEAGDRDAADIHLEEAARLLPAWPMPWYLRGKLHLDAGDPGRARPYLERAATLAPQSREGREARRLLDGMKSDGKGPDTP